MVNRSAVKPHSPKTILVSIANKIPPMESSATVVTIGGARIASMDQPTGLCPMNCTPSFMGSTSSGFAGPAVGCLFRNSCGGKGWREGLFSTAELVSLGCTRASLGPEKGDGLPKGQVGASNQLNAGGLEPQNDLVKMMMMLMEKQDAQRKEDLERMERMMKEERQRFEEQRQREVAQQREDMTRLLDQLRPVPQSQVAFQAHSTLPDAHVTTKLPRLKLPTFAGDRLEWLNFWESFELSVHNQERLQNKQKLDYLHQSLTGPAFDKIKGLGLQGNNYPEAIAILKDEYGKPQDLIEARVKLLHSLPSVKESGSNLESFVDEVRAASAFLVKMGIPQAGLDFQVYTLSQKLPQNYQNEIKRLRVLKGKANVGWTMKEFLELLGDMKLLLPSKVKAKQELKEPKSDQGQWMQVESAPTAATFMQSSTKKPNDKVCVFCAKTNHFSDDCLSVRDVIQRKAVLVKERRCFKCLSKDHIAAKCLRTKSCFHCKESGHHPSLCLKRKVARAEGSQHMASTEEEEEKESSQYQAFLAGPNDDDGVIMAMCPTGVSNPQSEHVQKMNVYLDAGARYTCIDRSSAKKLELEPIRKVVLNTARFNSNQTEKVHADLVQLRLHGENGFSLMINAYSVPNMAPPLPVYPIKLGRECWQKAKKFKPKNMPPAETTQTKIDILLGMDHWNDIMGPQICKPVAVDAHLAVYCSPLGAILAGNALASPLKDAPRVAYTMFCQVKKDLSDLWSLEAIGIKPGEEASCASKDEFFEKFKETTTFEKGRYHVRWPWKSEKPEISSNYNQAKFRLQRTLDTLCADSTKLGNFNDYNSIIQDQLEKGVVEPVQGKVPGATVVHYISHFPHIRSDRDTTKVRIVYDASARSKPHGTSLNDLMHVGNNYLEDLVGLLLRFRLSQIAITADVEKAFLQVGLQEKDRDSTRFLWLKNPKRQALENNIQVYRFTRIPFGVVSSPYLLGATINLLLDENPGNVSNQIKKNIYMDNVFLGAEDPDEAKRSYKEAKELFQRGSMNLREWLSNSKEFNDSLPHADRVKHTTTKVLGILWNTQSDCFQIRYKPEMSVEFATKRSILHTAAKTFDPLGLISPIVVLGRMKLQELWQEGKDWDDPISQKHRKEWESIVASIQKGSEIQFPRRVVAENSKNVWLACFCDASCSAYAAVVYLVASGSSTSKVSLIFSKARVAPVKQSITLPRLELLAVLLGSRLLRYVEKEIRLEVSYRRLWSDSQIVLHWVDSNKQLEPFVSRRITEIKGSGDIKFAYVSTKENPADIASRGGSYDELMKSSWFKGPSWLTKPCGQWPSWSPSHRSLQSTHNDESSSKLLRQSQALLQAPDPTEAVFPFDMDINKFSTLQRLLRVTAYCQRFIEALKGNQKHQQKYLKAVEMKAAKLIWIRAIQQSAFKEEIDALIQQRPTKFAKQLDLFLDTDLLRCGGRLSNARISNDAKFPVLLPKNHKFTELAIKHAHKSVLHFGKRCTLTELRKEYWIPHGLATVGKVLRDCIICRKAEGGPFQTPKMAQLPAARVCRSAAFSSTGLDYLGPLTIRKKEKGAENEKRWVAIFTCFVTRAVHLEIITDCTAESAVNAVKRFVARRGCPETILTDNATQFLKAANVLKAIWDDKIGEDTYKELTIFFANKDIKWRNIPERSPWAGGFYERLVGLVKRALKKVLWRARIDEDCLHTLIVDIEGVLNSRPLISLKAEFKDGGVLTPADFISPSPRVCFPTPKESDDDPDYFPPSQARKNLLRDFKKNQRRLDQFWTLWHSQYLQELKESHKLYFKARKGEVPRKPQKGEVVLVKESSPRVMWKLARVDELLPSQDDETRFVRLQLPNGGFTRRGMRDIIPLEMSIDHDMMGSGVDNDDFVQGLLPPPGECHED